MAILALLIFCNVLLAVIFKAFSRYNVDNLNAIVINYFVCVIVASIALGHFVIPADLFSMRWIGFSFVLSLCFIIGFNLMAYSFQKAGVAITAIVAKMSLVLPVIFAMAFYNESMQLLKGLGIISAIAAIVLVNFPSNKNGLKLSMTNAVLLLPLSVWILSGLIEIVLYYVQVEGLVTDDSMIFVASSFGIAGVLGLCYSLYRSVTARIYPSTKDLVGGIVLGVPNFMSIYLLLYLLEKGWEGTVLFPINNVGILLLTALVGIVFYREKVNSLKVVGMVLSIIGIILIGINA